MTKSIGMLVAGEVGPRTTRLALCGLDMGRPVIVVDETATNADFAGLGPMIHRFLTKSRPPQIRGAAFVVPGSVHEGRSLAANLPWPVEAQPLGAELGIERVAVLNDVEAIAHAIPTLAAEDLLVVSPGAPAEPGNQVVISAGACPGVAGLYWNGTEHCPFISEGAHADFAPSNEVEAELGLSLSRRVARVTVELLLSCEGVGFIHRHLHETGHDGEASRFDGVPSDEAADRILGEAALGADPTCQETLERFLAIYGSAAANIALTLRATGGVYLAGDILSRVRAALPGGAFSAAFAHKAPLHELLSAIPVHAILNERAALLGAAAVAARDLRSRRVGGWAS